MKGIGTGLTHFQKYLVAEIQLAGLVPSSFVLDVNHLFEYDAYQIRLTERGGQSYQIEVRTEELLDYSLEHSRKLARDLVNMMTGDRPWKLIDFEGMLIPSDMIAEVLSDVQMETFYKVTGHAQEYGMVPKPQGFLKTSATATEGTIVGEHYDQIVMDDIVVKKHLITDSMLDELKKPGKVIFMSPDEDSAVAFIKDQQEYLIKQAAAAMMYQMDAQIMKEFIGYFDPPKPPEPPPKLIIWKESPLPPKGPYHDNHPFKKFFY